MVSAVRVPVRDGEFAVARVGGLLLLRQGLKIREGGEIADGLVGRGGRLIGQAEDNDAGVAAGRVGANRPA